MPRPFTLAKAKTDWAEVHLEEVDRQLGIFFDRKPYELVSEIEAETGDKVYRVRMRENVSRGTQGISLAAGDVIHNARSALDLIYAALVTANRKTVVESDQFPVSKTPQKFNARLPEIRSRIGKDAADVIQVIEPYKGGDGNAIWCLHTLDIIDKHRLLLATGACIPVVSGPFYPVSRSGKVFPQRFPDPWWKFPIEDGAEISRIRFDPELEGYDKPNVTFDVALNEPEVVTEGKTILEMLATLLEEANRVIDALTPFV